MKVLLVNGSPNKKGCTDAALNIIKESLIKEGVESDIFCRSLCKSFDI